MSNFPFPWWDKTITIYNKYIDPTTQRVSWYRNTVNNCFWKADNTMFSMGRYGVSTIGVVTENKTILCRIPEDSRYVNKLAWDELSEGERSEHFTLANEDIIVLGEVEDDLNEYASGKRANDLVSKYKKIDSCLTIDNYVDNVRTGVELKHYKVVGK